MTQGVTGAEAGLTGDEQIKIALETMAARGGSASIGEIYQAVEQRLQGQQLSDQGKASLRFYINKVAVQAGFVFAYDQSNPGWRITPAGYEYIATPSTEPEEVLNVATQKRESTPSNTVRGTAFEHYILRLLRKMHPYYTWYHQGNHKRNERGLDMIGDKLGDSGDAPRSIGVQVKLHAPTNAPTQVEWLKFLAGCFARRVEGAIFITSGRLTGEQRREAGEARVTVIEGRDEVNRIAQLYQIETFDLYDI